MAGSLRHDELAAVRLLGEGALQFLPLRLGLAFLVGVDAEQVSGSLVCKHDQRKIRRDGRQIAELPERGLEPIVSDAAASKACGRYAIARAPGESPT